MTGSTRFGLALVFSLAALSAAGCGWISNLGIPQEIRDKGLLTELEKPMPLGQPFAADYSAYPIEHPSEMRALLVRLDEFASGLEDPALRAAYAKALAGGEPSRTDAFHALYLNQSGGLSESEKQHALWERIDDGLAQARESELLEERLIALAVFVRDADPGAAARLTQAIRDDWNPESPRWRTVIASIEGPSDPLWTDAWAAASQKDLDNALGTAILDRLSGLATPPTIHPFATPRQVKVLDRRMRESQDPRELHNLLGQFQILDDETGEALWQAAKARPAGLVRLEAAFEWFRRSGSPDALDVLKQAVSDERYAVAALNGLSRLGRTKEISLPTGEALARAKAHSAVALFYRFLDAEANDVTVTPMISGKAPFEEDMIEVSLFRYSLSSPAMSLQGVASSDGVAIVDERLALMPDESPNREPAASGDPYGKVQVAPLSATGSMEEPEKPSHDLAFDRVKLDELHDEGCVTALDLLAAIQIHVRRRGIHDMPEVYGRYDELKQRLLDADEGWKAFDVPLETLGLTFEKNPDGAPDESLPVEEAR